MRAPPELEQLDEEQQILTRRFRVIDVRAIDKEKRTAEFVAATDDAVDMGWGKEVLPMSGCDLVRFNSNPIVLNVHRRWSVLDVVGRAPEPKLEPKQLVVKIAFSKATEVGRAAWDLVEEGTLRTLSVGYWPKKVRYLEDEKEVFGEGESQVCGPCFVAVEWELLEVSVAPVPADPRALKRAWSRAYPNPKESTVKDAKDAGATAPTTGTPPTEGNRAAGAGAPTPTPTPTPPTPAPAPAPTPIDAEQAAGIEARKRLILSFTPTDLRSHAEGLLLADPMIAPEKARAALLEEQAKRMAPVGTPPATPPTRTQPSGAPAPAGETTTKKVVTSGGDVVRAMGAN